MSNTFIISDLHLGHANILTFKRADGITPLRNFISVEEMNETIISNWNRVVRPNDKVYNLGDCVIHRKALQMLRRLNGRQRLIRGNHDIFKTAEYLEFVDEIYGVRVLSDMILSHIPLARDCITTRFGTNIHGHLHSNNIADGAYYNVSVENIGYTPISLDDLRKKVAEKKELYK